MLSSPATCLAIFYPTLALPSPVVSGLRLRPISIRNEIIGAVFEAVHGSAPDIAGKGIANPIATLWSAVMMLDFFNQNDASKALMGAIETVTAEGQALTPDLGGQTGTQEFTDAVLEKMSGK